MKKMRYGFLAALVLMVSVAAVGQTYHDLSAGNFTQNWSNTGLITVANDWTGVPSIQGFRGDALTAATGVDPQTVVSGDDAAPVLNVTQNVTVLGASGGLIEAEIADPVVAFQGSGTADAPYLVIYLNTTNTVDISVAYNLRDIDGSTDNSIQQVALQYRLGTSGDFTNIAAGYVADASTGPSLATAVTAVSLTLPVECENQAQVQLRIITTNAASNDEFIGIDDISIGGTLLPVELTSFTAIAKGKNVELKWNTATELNNFGFEVEKNVSGSWSKIGFVEGNGTTNAPKSYSYADANVSGTVSYRLKQIDRDGQFEYSPVVEATVADIKSFGLDQNYPNPFNPNTAISYQLAANSLTTLKVYDALGREVATLVNEVKEAGSYSAIFNASQLSSGIYFYTLQSGNFTATKKLTLMK